MQCRMYSEWKSLTEAVQNEPNPNSVLTTFPPTVGRDVVHAVLKPLSETTNSTRAPSPNPLSTAEQVHWTMQVIGYGLTLPLNEQQLIASCIDVYDIWLNALTTKKGSIPEEEALAMDKLLGSGKSRVASVVLIASV